MTIGQEGMTTSDLMEEIWGSGRAEGEAGGSAGGSGSTMVLVAGLLSIGVVAHL